MAGILPPAADPMPDDEMLIRMGLLAPPRDPREDGPAPWSGLPPYPGYAGVRTSDRDSFLDADLSQRMRDEAHRDLRGMSGEGPPTIGSTAVMGITGPAVMAAPPVAGMLSMGAEGGGSDGREQ